DNRIDSGAFCFQAESNDAANVGVVGYANAMVAEVRCFSNECFGGNGAVAEGERSVGTELDGHILYVIPNKPRSYHLAASAAFPSYDAGGWDLSCPESISE